MAYPSVIVGSARSAYRRRAAAVSGDVSSDIQRCVSQSRSCRVKRKKIGTVSRDGVGRSVGDAALLQLPPTSVRDRRRKMPLVFFYDGAVF